MKGNTFSPFAGKRWKYLLTTPIPTLFIREDDWHALTGNAWDLPVAFVRLCIVILSVLSLGSGMEIPGSKDLHQVVSITLEVPMFDWKSICFMVPVLAIPVATAVVVIPPTVEQLHIQTVRQCQEKDWPKAQAPQHEEFCDLYLSGKY